jgi:hypothetical protein
MKYTLILVLFFVLGLVSCGDENVEKDYCGVITETGYEEPTSGYKSNRDPCYFVIMNVDSINKKIRINVTVPTYYALKKGDRTCFKLSGYDLNLYGNSPNSKHLIK